MFISIKCGEWCVRSGGCMWTICDVPDTTVVIDVDTLSSTAFCNLNSLLFFAEVTGNFR